MWGLRIDMRVSWIPQAETKSIFSCWGSLLKLQLHKGSFDVLAITKVIFNQYQEFIIE